MPAMKMARMSMNVWRSLIISTIIRTYTACEQRASKKLVADDGNDARFQSEKFASAPAMFANNDVKYDVNKLRATAFAAKQNTGVMYCPAKDAPTQDALRVRSDLSSQKLHWLKRHDRESGDLYGVLPLINGMPVAMTDHVGKSRLSLLLPT